MRVHCVPLRDGCAKVKITVVSKPYRGFALPVEEQEFTKLGEAENNYVQWPVNLIKELGNVI